jgi:ACR3 family arsenite transporter
VGGVVHCARYGFGEFLNSSYQFLSTLEFYKVNLPIAVLIWLMIYPMMLQVDFSSIKDVSKTPKGLILTLVINWLIKPFTMAFFRINIKNSIKLFRLNLLI